ncbi:MAG: hypothetical protein L0Z47_04015 [Actinobacteria bacterium]|nr:hypothetical protein [Actinomycetota bacterium]
MPSLALGALAAVLGWLITDVSCRETRPLTGCVGWSWLVAAVSFVLVLVGVGLLLVLVYRSLTEWRQGR